MRRKGILLFLILLLCSVSGAADSLHQAGIKYPALLCANCGFGSKKDNCVKCGKWVASHSYPARLCSNCGFGSKKDNCVLCGKWVANNGVPAKLCANCGFGDRHKNCVKCGKYVFD